jgi:hypothetical protein
MDSTVSYKFFTSLISEGVWYLCVVRLVFVIRQVRQSAGLLLKNNLKYHYAGATPELRQYIKVGQHAQCRPLKKFQFMNYPNFLSRHDWPQIWGRAAINSCSTIQDVSRGIQCCPKKKKMGFKGTKNNPEEAFALIFWYYTLQDARCTGKTSVQFPPFPPSDMYI